MLPQALKRGTNEVVVRVEDETEGFQLRGKQTLNARGIWYTQVSGIWQTVWMESVSPHHIQDLKIATDAQAGTITVRPILSSDAPSQVHVVVKDGSQTVAEARKTSGALVLTVPNAKLWAPGSPHLYDLEVTLLDPAGNALDTVRSYAGIRDVGKVKDANGHWRFTINGEPIFHWGPLDQGWWPDGLLTPPSDEAMLFDIAWLKSASFKHDPQTHQSRTASLLLSL